MSTNEKLDKSVTSVTMVIEKSTRPSAARLGTAAHCDAEKQLNEKYKDTVRKQVELEREHVALESRERERKSTAHQEKMTEQLFQQHKTMSAQKHQLAFVNDTNKQLRTELKGVREDLSNYKEATKKMAATNEILRSQRKEADEYMASGDGVNASLRSQLKETEERKEVLEIRAQLLLKALELSKASVNRLVDENAVLRDQPASPTATQIDTHNRALADAEEYTVVLNGKITSLRAQLKDALNQKSTVCKFDNIEVIADEYTRVDNNTNPPTHYAGVRLIHLASGTVISCDEHTHRDDNRSWCDAELKAELVSLLTKKAHKLGLRL